MSDSNITKKALAGALKGMMAEQPFSKIGVGDICERCGMSRKSFYYHFKDKYDLVNWVFYTEFIEILSLPSSDSSQTSFPIMCAYFYRERAFYRSALLIEGQNSFRAYFCEVMAPLLVDMLHELYVLERGTRAFVDFFVDAILVAVIRWLTEERSVTDREFVARIRSVLLATAQATLRQPDDSKMLLPTDENK